MREMLGGVVTGGTAKPAQLAGYSAGGKTGTAHKFDQNTKRYSPNHYYASFAGFAPLNNPQLAIMVMINDPKGAYHGGQVAAPVFKRVAEFALDRLGVQPDQPMKNAFVAVNDQHTEDEGNEETTLPTGAGLDVVANSDSSVDSVIQQFQPNAAVQNQVAQEQPAQTQTENRSVKKPVESSIGRMPDFRGRGARSAAEICAQLGVKLVAKGSGVVTDQNPKAGTALEAGTVCYLTLSR
jgi:membrane peptidoglycan carboxypeptidase